MNPKIDKPKEIKQADDDTSTQNQEVIKALFISRILAGKYNYVFNYLM